MTNRSVVEEAVLMAQDVQVVGTSDYELWSRAYQVAGASDAVDVRKVTCVFLPMCSSRSRNCRLLTGSPLQKKAERFGELHVNSS